MQTKYVYQVFSVLLPSIWRLKKLNILSLRVYLFKYLWNCLEEFGQDSSNFEGIRSDL